MAYVDVEMCDVADLPVGDISGGSHRRYQHAAPRQIYAAMHVDQTRTASIFIVADTNIYLHSLPLLERFMYHLGPSCGAVADLGSVGLQCAVIIPQVVWRELDGLKGREDRRAAVHNAIRLVNADEHSERPFFIHQTLQLLEQAEAIHVAPFGLTRNGDDSILQCYLLYQRLLQGHQAAQQHVNHTDMLVLLTDDENLRGRAHAAGIAAHRSNSLSPRDATALYSQLLLREPARQAAGMHLYAAQSEGVQQPRAHYGQQCSIAHQQQSQQQTRYIQQPDLRHQPQQHQQVPQYAHPDQSPRMQQQQHPRLHVQKNAARSAQPQSPHLQQHRPEHTTMLQVHTPQHGASSAHSVQRQHSPCSNQSPASRSIGSPAASHSFAPSPHIAGSPGGTEWHGAATAALSILLDSLQPAMGAILAHTLGPDIWQECLDPRPPWRTARDMLMVLLSARDSLGLRHADSGEFFRARDDLWACANALRQNRGKDEVPAFVRRVLNACRQMLSVARRCLAFHCTAPDWPASVDAEHMMEQLQADDEHLRGVAKSVPPS